MVVPHGDAAEAELGLAFLADEADGDADRLPGFGQQLVPVFRLAPQVIGLAAVYPGLDRRHLPVLRLHLVEPVEQPRQ